MNKLLLLYNSVESELLSYKTKLASLHQSKVALREQYEMSILEARDQINETVSEIDKKIARTTAMIAIARDHGMLLRPALSPKEYDSLAMSRLAVQISGNSDRFADMLYTEATAQKMFLDAERERILQTLDYECARIKRSNGEKATWIDGQIQEVAQSVRSYLSSNSVSSFFTNLIKIRDAFICNKRDTLVDELLSNGISFGFVVKPLAIPAGFADQIASIARESCDTKKEIIFLPYIFDFNGGKTVIIEHNNSNEKKVLGAVQSIILDTLRSTGSDSIKISVFDPVRFNATCLGALSPLCDSTNPVIAPVPSSKSELSAALDSAVNTYSDYESSASSIRGIFVFINFPNGYDSIQIAKIQQLCVNATYYGIHAFLLNNISTRGYTNDSVRGYLEPDSLIIKCGAQGDFSIDGNAFVWHSAPSILPSDIRAKYITTRKELNLSSNYLQRIGFSDLPLYKKGDRSITNIPYGVDAAGNICALDFENDNFATFICGAARSGKSTLLHTIISGLIQNKHPDDVEIWLVDFKMIEFSKYIKHLPPHVRYIILDESPELVYDIIDRLSDILKKRENIFKEKWDKLQKVPKEKYMPALFVIIDEFSVMSQILSDSVLASNDNYAQKLQKILAAGAGLGMHFIFASQGFTSGTRGLTPLAKMQIQQRIAMKTEYNEIRETLALKSTSDNDKKMMEELRVHHTLLRIPVDKRGNHLLQAKVLFIEDYSQLDSFIDKLNSTLAPAQRFQPQNEKYYISKKPLIKDGNTYYSYSMREPDIRKILQEMVGSVDFDEDVALFLGEPSRMLPVYPTTVCDEFGENILLVAPNAEKAPAASVIISIVNSLNLQKKQYSILSSKKSMLYRQIKSSLPMASCFINDLDSICKEIQELRSCIERKVSSSKFVFLLGYEMLVSDFSLLPNVPSIGETRISQLTVKPRTPGELDVLTMLRLAENGEYPTAESNSDKPSNTEESLPQSMGAYDAREDINFILTNGPRYGYHVIMAFPSPGDIQQCKVNTSLFKHKVLFRMPKNDAYTLAGAANAAVITDLEDHAFRYSNGIDGVSFRPFLHPGLSWDGWHQGEGDVGSEQNEEDYLL